jgi:hypothetical protein
VHSAIVDGGGTPSLRQSDAYHSNYYGRVTTYPPVILVSQTYKRCCSLTRAFLFEPAIPY